jgi:aspartate/methionine/tyrosine aminotransferase
MQRTMDATPPSSPPEAAQRYPFSVIREAMAKRDGVLDFALGKHRVEPPAALLQLIRNEPELAVRRSETADHAAFAEAAVTMLADVYGVHVPPACVLPVPGGRAAISAVIARLVEPGDGVLVTEPGYPVFSRLAAQHHARVLTASLDPQRAFAPDLGPLAGQATPVRLAALNYPNNPTGAVLTPGIVASLGAALPGDAVLFNDATYGPLTYDGGPCSLLADDLAGAVGQPLVELHSLAKLFGLSGLPVSFLVGTETLIQQLRDYCDFAVTPMSRLQVRVSSLCAANTRHLADTRDLFADRVGRLRAVLQDLGFGPYPTPAGLYVLTREPSAIGGCPVTGARHAAEILLDAHGVAVMPWEAPPHGYVRFSSLYRPDDLGTLKSLAAGRPLAET